MPDFTIAGDSANGGAAVRLVYSTGSGRHGRRCGWLVLFGMAAITWLPRSAAPAAPGTLFADDSLLQLELSGPLQALLEQREERPELDFTLRAEGREDAVSLRVRGNSRLRRGGFPPLRITFAGEDTGNSLFAGQRQVKFVSHCDLEGAERYDVREEYAAYRIFNLLTDASYRVRLLHVTW